MEIGSSTLGISVMKEELQPLGMKDVEWKSLMKAVMSLPKVFQCFLKSLKENPSGPGAFSPPQFQMASLML
jgi:hypothetical protein